MVDFRHPLLQEKIYFSKLFMLSTTSVVTLMTFIVSRYNLKNKVPYPEVKGEEVRTIVLINTRLL